MFVLGAVAAIISMFFPFAGVLFILAISGKYQHKFLEYKFFAAFAVSAVIFKISGIIDTITLFDLILGVAIPSFCFLIMMKKSEDQMRSLLYSILLVIGYSFLRMLIFHDAFVSLINQAMEQNRILLSESFLGSGEDADLLLASLEKIRDFILSYFTGLWCLIMILAYYTGALIHWKRKGENFKHRLFRLPYMIIYALIIILILFLFNPTRQLSVNLIFIIASFFLIQGFAVIDFFWGKTFTKRRIFLYLMLIALILNPYLLILVVMTGLFDVWFNFRKINIVEEVDESHPD